MISIFLSDAERANFRDYLRAILGETAEARKNRFNELVAGFPSALFMAITNLDYQGSTADVALRIQVRLEERLGDRQSISYFVTLWQRMENQIVDVDRKRRLQQWQARSGLLTHLETVDFAIFANIRKCLKSFLKPDEWKTLEEDSLRNLACRLLQYACNYTDQENPRLYLFVRHVLDLAVDQLTPSQVDAITTAARTLGGLYELADDYWEQAKPVAPNTNTVSNPELPVIAVVIQPLTPDSEYESNLIDRKDEELCHTIRLHLWDEVGKYEALTEPKFTFQVDDLTAESVQKGKDWLKGALREAANRLSSDAVPRIEFFLPYSLLLELVHTWPFKEKSRDVDLFYKYGVTVRALARYDDQTAMRDMKAALKRNWWPLMWFKPPLDMEQMDSQIYDDNASSCFAFTQEVGQSAKEYLQIAIEAGLPYGLWICQQESQSAPCKVQTHIEKKLLKNGEGSPPDMLRQAVMKVRKSDKAYGKRMILLYETTRYPALDCDFPSYDATSAPSGR